MADRFHSILLIVGASGKFARTLFFVLQPLPSLWQIGLALALVWLANLQLSVLLSTFISAPIAPPFDSRRGSKDSRASADGDHPNSGIR